MHGIHFEYLNYWAILVAVIFNQGLGAAWYSILAKPWMDDTGMTRQDVEAMKGTPRQWYPYVIAVVSGIVFTFGLAMLAQKTKADHAVEGLALGLLVAIGFVFTSNAVNYAYEGRSLRLFLINAGYPLISYGVIGIMLSVWR